MYSKSNTRNTLWATLLLLTLFLLSVLTSCIRWYKQESEFVQQDLNQLQITHADSLTSETEMELLHKLLTFAGNNGTFKGTLTQQRRENGDLQLTIHDDFARNESLGVRERRFIAKKENGNFIVTQYFSRQSCQNHPYILQKFLNIFIHPLWTKETCK